MILSHLTDEELEKYIEEYRNADPKYQTERRNNEIKAQYLKNIDSIIFLNNKLQSKLNELKSLLAEKKFQAVYNLCDKLAVDSEKIVQQIRKLPVEFGCKDGYTRVRNSIAAAADIKFKYLQHNILHIILPDLLPPRVRYDAGSKKITHRVDYDYIRSSYMEAFNVEFRKGKQRIHTKQVVLVYINFYESDLLLKDHDNLDPKIITDIITQHVLIDDNPKWVAHYMDYGYADKNHTEIYVVPFEIFPNFLVTLNKQIAKNLCNRQGGK